MSSWQFVYHFRAKSYVMIGRVLFPKIVMFLCRGYNIEKINFETLETLRLSSCGNAT